MDPLAWGSLTAKGKRGGTTRYVPPPQLTEEDYYYTRLQEEDPRPPMTWPPTWRTMLREFGRMLVYLLTVDVCGIRYVDYGMHDGDAPCRRPKGHTGVHHMAPLTKDMEAPMTTRGKIRLALSAVAITVAMAMLLLNARCDAPRHHQPKPSAYTNKL